jgi:hypothetical protein
VKAAKPAPTQQPDPKSDLYGHYERAIRELAAKVGLPWRDLYDEFGERAAIREWDGWASRDESEALAFQDVVQRVKP